MGLSIKLCIFGLLTYGLQLIRPEFQSFHDNEQTTLQMVKDVADTLEDSAANNLHTPALYSVFLRALISARLDPNSTNGGSSEDDDINQNQGASSRDMPPPQIHQPAPYPNDPSFHSEFDFESEMGPVADMSTFPPTMAPVPAEDASTAGLTMDNILSSGFWDSVLVPGK